MGWGLISTFLLVMTLLDKKAALKTINDINEKIKQDEEDRNVGREKIPVLFGDHTYYIYRDATMEEASKVIPYTPTYISTNFKAGLIRYEYPDSWMGRCINGNTLRLNFIDNRLTTVTG